MWFAVTWSLHGPTGDTWPRTMSRPAPGHRSVATVGLPPCLRLDGTYPIRNQRLYGRAP